MTVEVLECLEAGNPLSKCEGPVEYRWPGYGEKQWPRCEKHGEERIDRERVNQERYPEQRPADFDPLAAGERWDEDDPWP